MRGLEALTRHRGIVGAAGCEIEAAAAHPRLAHGIEIGVGRLVIDRRDTAGVGAARLHPVERRGIVGAVNARRHDHNPLDLQRAMQRRHLLGQGHLGRVDAPGEERKLLRVAVDVGVAVARIRRHVEVHRRCQLRCLGKAFGGSHQGSSAHCADHRVSMGSSVASQAIFFRLDIGRSAQSSLLLVARPMSSACPAGKAGRFHAASED
jgi:hypothetical protein